MRVTSSSNLTSMGVPRAKFEFSPNKSSKDLLILSKLGLPSPIWSLGFRFVEKVFEARRNNCTNNKLQKKEQARKELRGQIRQRREKMWGSYHPPPKPDPPIVVNAKNGSLQGVIDAYNKDPKLLEASGKWTEVQEKHGYDKEWTWDKDTPLIAAARYGHLDVVNFLLSKGADALASSCLTEDVHETALDVATKNKYAEIVAVLRLKVDENNNEIAAQRAEQEASHKAKVEMDRTAYEKKKEEIRNNLWERCSQPPSLATLCCDRMHQVCPSGNDHSMLANYSTHLPSSLMIPGFNRCLDESCTYWRQLTAVNNTVERTSRRY